MLVKSSTRKSTSKISNIMSDDINKNVYSPQGSKIRREKWIYSNSKKSFPGLSNVSMFLSSSSRLFPIRRKLLIENYLTLIPFLQEIVFFCLFLPGSGNVLRSSVSSSDLFDTFLSKTIGVFIIGILKNKVVKCD